MKKLLAGCLIVAGLAGVALGAALYFGYRAVSPMIDNASAFLQQVRDAAAQSSRVENTSPYTPPADGTLTEAQLRRFLAVHARTRQALGTRWDELRAQADRIGQQAKQDAREVSLGEIVTMFRAAGGLIRQM